MKVYSAREFSDSLRAVGVVEGDLLYLTSRLHGIGRFSGATSREVFLEGILEAIIDVIGPSGTIVVPTYTQQVARFGLPYVHEETVSLTGIFGEYLRQLPNSVRSLHPVFSVTAHGPLKHAICDDISPVGFGYDSAFDRMRALSGKSVCVGFEYYSGHIVTLMHYVETMFAVPYYYNKLVSSPVIKNRQQIDKPFVINVKYLNLECEFSFNRYIDELSRHRHLRSAPIGDTMIYAADIDDVFNVGINLLKSDIYAFLKNPPRYSPGEIPMDGPQQPMEAMSPNWAGYYLGL